MPAPDSADTIDLGSGVVVAQRSDHSLLVGTESLAMPWQVRQGTFPGAAVRWQDEIWEVVSSDHHGPVTRFHLSPWSEGEALRTVTPLDRETVAALAAAAEQSARDSSKRRWLVALMPLTGMLPRAMQMRLEKQLNFPAERATMVSALCELPLGGVGLLQAILLAVASEWILPPPLRWLASIGPLLFLEALIRMWFTTSQGEPMGSILLFPLNLLKPKTDGSIADRPTPVSWDPDSDELRLSTSEGRPDWTEGGVLRFRGRLFRLVTREGHRSAVVYHFEAAPSAAEATLQLMPPARQPPVAVGEPTPGPLSMLIRTLLMSLAPGRYQQAWFPRFGTPAMMPTIATAVIEAVGGAYNMLTTSSTGIAGIVDLFFLCEGVLRLVLAFARKAPVGSLLGLPFTSLFQRWTLTPADRPPDEG